MTNFKKLDLLLALYITAIVFSELMGSKIVNFFSLINASVAVLALPLTFSINDIVSEVYGKKRAVSFMAAGLKILIVLFVLNFLALLLPAADRFMPTNPAYIEVFGKSLRMIVASLLAFYLSEKFDIYIFSRIRKKFGKNKLWLRVNLSNLLGQLVDTSVFMFLAFYKPGNALFIISLIIPYWLLKYSFAFVETPLVYWGVKWLKKPESVISSGMLK